jgi:predicted esterase
MAVPAIVRDNANLEALSGMPVYLRIGGEDQLGWASQFDESVERLKEFGTVLDAEILDGAPHMFDMDWERLEPWLETVKQ